MDIVYMLTFVFSFILGTIVGSFLNVVILRYNMGRTILNRSGCFSCGKTLRPQELFPIISFLVSRGRCVSCGSRISLQYPIVELISGLLFTCIAYKFMLAGASIFPLSIVSASLYATAFSIFLTITVYDLRHTIIPNAFVYAFIGISILLFLIRSAGAETFIAKDSFFWGAFVGPLFALTFASFWYLSGGKLMGLGDAKIALGMGFLLGVGKMVSAVLIAFWGGALVGIGLLLLRSRYFTMKSEIPFAPFLFIGTILAFLLDVNVTFF